MTKIFIIVFSLLSASKLQANNAGAIVCFNSLIVWGNNKECLKNSEIYTSGARQNIHLARIGDKQIPVLVDKKNNKIIAVTENGFFSYDIPKKIKKNKNEMPFGLLKLALPNTTDVVGLRITDIDSLNEDQIASINANEEVIKAIEANIDAIKKLIKINETLIASAQKSIKEKTTEIKDLVAKIKNIPADDKKAFETNHIEIQDLRTSIDTFQLEVDYKKTANNFYEKQLMSLKSHGESVQSLLATSKISQRDGEEFIDLLSNVDLNNDDTLNDQGLKVSELSWTQIYNLNGSEASTEDNKAFLKNALLALVKCTPASQQENETAVLKNKKEPNYKSDRLNALNGCKGSYDAAFDETVTASVASIKATDGDKAKNSNTHNK